MITVVIMVVLIVILAAVFIQGSMSSIDKATETKYLQEISEVKKGVNAKRLSNSKKGLTEESLNKGFIKVEVQDAPTDFESFDEDKITGYLVDLNLIEYEKASVGQAYLDFAEEDTIKFNVDDVFVYDALGTVYYAKGFISASGDSIYLDETDVVRKDGPTINVLSTENGHVELEVLPFYEGEITSVTVGSLKATSTDGKHFECNVPGNGSYIVIATEEGGNSTRTTVIVADMEIVNPEKAVINNIYFEGSITHTNQKVATLMIDATNASHLYIGVNKSAVPSVVGNIGWRDYSESVAVSLKEGSNVIYVWAKNSADVMTQHKTATIIVDTVAPSKDAPDYEINGFEITVRSNQSDGNAISTGNLKLEYGYKDVDEAEFTWQESNIILDVAPGEKMELKTRATDLAGNISESRVVLTEEMPGIPGGVKITEDNSDWTTTKIVTIEYPNTYGIYPYTNYYRIDDGEWIEANSNNERIRIINNCYIEAVVAARFNDEQTRMGDIVGFEVTKVDRNNPELVNTMPDDDGTVYSTGYDVIIAGQDFESGLVSWTVTSENIEPLVWDNFFDATTELTNLVFRVERNGIYYVWAKDAVGLISSIEVRIENIDLTDPVISTYNVEFGVAEATLTASIQDSALGLVAYAWTKGENAIPDDADWVAIDKTLEPLEVKHTVTENDYYTIWAKDISGRTARVSKYIKVIFSVTYDFTTNGGTSLTGTGVSTTKNVTYVGCNTEIDLTPVAKRSKSTFLGWNTNPNATVGLTSARVGTVEDVILYAIFSRELKLTFFYYEGTTPTKLEVKAYLYNNDESVVVDIPEIDAVHTNWTSRGWTLSTAYNAEVEYALKNASIEIEDHTNLYMLYQKNVSATYKYFKTESIVDVLPIYTNTYDISKTTIARFTAPEIEVTVKKEDKDNGWTFRGWSEDVSETATIELADKATFETGADIVYYASYVSEVFAKKMTYGSNVSEDVSGLAYLGWNGKVTNAKINLGTPSNVTYKNATWRPKGWTIQEVATGLVNVNNNGNAEIYIDTIYYALYGRDVNITTKIYDNESVLVSSEGLLNATGHVLKASMELPKIEDIRLSGVSWAGRGYSFDTTAQATIEFEQNETVNFDEDVTLYASYYRNVQLSKVNFYSTEITDGVAYATYRGAIDKVSFNVGTTDSVYYNGVTWLANYWVTSPTIEAAKALDLNGTIELIDNATYYMMYGRDVKVTKYLYENESEIVAGKALLDTSRNVQMVDYVLGNFANVTVDGVFWESREWCDILNFTDESATTYSKTQTISTYKDEDYYALYGDTINVGVYTLDNNATPKYTEITGTRVMTRDGKVTTITTLTLPELLEVEKDNLTWTPIGYLSSEAGYTLDSKDGSVSRVGGSTIIPGDDVEYYAIYETNATVTKVIYDNQLTSTQRITMNANADIGGAEITLGTIANVTVEERIWQGYGWDDSKDNFINPAYGFDTEIIISGNRTFYASYSKKVALELQEFESVGVTKSNYLEATAYMNSDGVTEKATLIVEEPESNTIEIESEVWNFNGWSLSNELGSELSNEVGSAVTTLDDTVLFARYVRTLTLTLHTFDNVTRAVHGNAEANTLGIRAESAINIGKIDSVIHNSSTWIGRGWSTDDAPNAEAGFIDASSEIANISKDTNLYASYITDITVDFVSYSGDVRTVKTKTGTISMNYVGDVIGAEIVTPPQETMVLNGETWASEGYTLLTGPDVADEDKVLSTVTTDQSLIFYGLYSRIISITYDANGGTMDETITEGKQKVNAKDLTLRSNPTLTIAAPIPARNGYTFQNRWTEVPDQTDPGYEIGDELTIAENTTLYALWAPAIYTIEYNVAGGEGEFIPVTKTYNEDIVLSSTIPTREGYVFKGWAISSDSNIPIYQPGDTYSANESVTLYAVWQQKIYALIYSDNTMGFNSTGLPKVGKTLLDESYVWQLENEFAGISDVPWYDVEAKKDIISVEFEEEIKPTWTAAWFYGFKSLEEIKNFEYLNSRNVITMANMFEGCNTLKELNLRTLDTSSVLSMNGMFKDCTTIGYLDISSFDISVLNSANNMFYNCSNLKTIYSAEGFTMQNVPNASNMFRDCILLVGGTGTVYNRANVGKEMAKVDFGEGYGVSTQGYFTGTNMRVYALAYNDGTLGFNTTGVAVAGKTLYSKNSVWVVPFAFENEEDIPWYSYRNLIKQVTFEEKVIPNATSWWFSGCTGLTSIANMSNLDTSNVRETKGMFNNCRALTSIDVSNFNTSKVTDMSYMFAGCKKVTTLDLSPFNTSKVTNMSNMFAGNEIMTKVNIASFNTTFVTDMSAMFKDCKALTKIDLRNISSDNVTNMSSMFENCSTVTYLDLSGFNTINVLDTSKMFKDCTLLATIYASANFVTGQITSSNEMFKNTINIIGGAGTEYIDIATDKVYARIDKGITTAGYFTLDKIYALYYNDDTMELNETGIPSNGKTLRDEDSYWGVAGKYANAAARPWNEYATRITEVTVVDQILPISTAYWFAGFSNVTTFRNLSNIDMRIAKYTSNMFDGCTAISNLDVSTFNLANAINADYMFKNCENIDELDFTSWNTPKLASKVGMFEGCIRLVKVDIGARCTIQSALPAPNATYIDGANGKWYNSLGQGFASSEIPLNKLDTYYGSIRMVPATLAEKQTWYKGTTDPATITNIVITNSYEITNLETETWFADESNIGAIKCYVIDNILYIVNNNYAYDKGAIMLAEDVTGLFSAFTSTKNINGLKLFSTIRTQKMDEMFGRNGVGCGALQKLSGYEDWNVSNVISVKDMFSGAGIKDIDVSMLNFESLRNYEKMFNGSRATTITIGEFEVENATSMFANCPSLQLINLSQMDFDNLTNTTSMFENSAKLITVYVVDSFEPSSIITSTNMFAGCTSILGGAGTIYDANYVDRRYAKIDEETNPGYFTSYVVGAGALSAKLYEVGTVGTTFVELTEEGVDAPAWSYRKGAKLLEIKASNLMAGEEKIVKISVPTGMYIQANSWTKVGEYSGITNVSFETLDIEPATTGIQQGTGVYTNSQTGTLTITIGKYAAYSKIQLLVMYDQTVWDKQAGNGYLTKEPAVVVVLNDSQKVQINNVTASENFGGGTSLYADRNTTNLYIGDGYEQQIITTSMYLANDQSSYNGFYKEVEVQTALYGLDAVGNTIYAKYKKYTGFSGANAATVTTENGVTTFKKSDVHFTGSIQLPKPYYTLESATGFIQGGTVTYRQIVRTVDYVGKERIDTRTISYNIASPVLNYNNINLYAGGATAAAESYHGGKEYYDYLGVMGMNYTGVANAPDIDVKVEFDTAAGNGVVPNMKVTSYRIPLNGGRSTVAKVTLVNESGTQFGPYNVSLTSAGNTSGAYLKAQAVASANSLSGKYFLKNIEYTMDQITGALTQTNLYSPSGSASPSGGGTLYGWITKSATSRITVTFPDGCGVAPKTATITTSPTTAPVFAGEISSYQIGATSITAGNNVTLDLYGGASYYPYSHTLHMNKPTYYIVLPDGVSVSDAVFSTSRGGSSIAEVEITKGKPVTIDSVIHYVYMITTAGELHFGGVSEGTTGRSIDNCRWLRVTLATESTLDMTTLMIRDLVSMKNGELHSSVSGSQGAYRKADPYDVDNDGNYSDSYATINSTTASIQINPVEE